MINMHTIDIIMNTEHITLSLRDKPSKKFAFELITVLCKCIFGILSILRKSCTHTFNILKYCKQRDLFLSLYIYIYLNTLVTP